MPAHRRGQGLALVGPPAIRFPFVAPMTRNPHVRPTLLHRFIDGDIDRSAFIPFGAGPRQCIGRDFAYVEAVLLLASLVAHFDVEYPAGEHCPSAVPLVTMRPTGGLHLRVRARLGA